MDETPQDAAGKSPGTTWDTAGRLLVRCLPLLMIVLGTVLEASAPRELKGMPFFAAAPLISAPFFTWAATLLYGGLGLLMVLVLHAIKGTAGGVPGVYGLITELATLAFVTALAVLLNRVVRRDRGRLASARDIAEAAQRAVLPQPEQCVGGLMLGTRYEAARKGTLIGGDLYAARSTPYGVRLLIGDVRGKGLGAIETVSVILGAFREAADREPTLCDVTDSMERSLARERSRGTGSDDAENFTTCVLVEVSPGNKHLRVLNRGHPEPLLLRGDGEVVRLSPHAFALPLGLGDLAPGPAETMTYEFPPESTLLLYTDGLSEARSAEDIFYDPFTRLSGRTFASADHLLDALVADVRRYTDDAQSDDMALLAVGRPAEAMPEPPEHEEGRRAAPSST